MIYSHTYKNGELIDKIIQEAEEYPDAWNLIHYSTYFYTETNERGPYSRLLAILEEELPETATNYAWYIAEEALGTIGRNNTINLYIVICGLMAYDSVHLIDAPPEEVKLLSKFDMPDAKIFYVAALANEYIRKQRHETYL